MDQARAVLHSGDAGKRIDAPFCFWLSLNDYKAPQPGEPLFERRTGREGDYLLERWWVTEADRAWQRGESTAEGPKRRLREFRNLAKANFDWLRQLPNVTAVDIEDWERMIQMSEAEFEVIMGQWYSTGCQTQPANWNDDGYNHPSQPVVGICWYEARAYCAWLSSRTGHDFRLPTEAEWEAAARGMEDRRYAYGNGYDPARCNTFATHIRRATPIGVFLGGETPDPVGIVDMAGNVWDWTSSLYKLYPYDATDGREAPSADESSGRVVRGGSWSAPPLGALACFRSDDNPAYRLFSLGFRVCCSSYLFVPL
jgi:formylglycine-generating enzyme required for sulfatase activity